MKDALQLLHLLLDNPLLACGVVGVALLFVFVWPIARVFAKRLEATVEHRLDAVPTAELWPRIASFIALLHLIGSIAAACWSAYNDWPVPGVKPDRNQTLGPEVERFVGFMICTAGACFGALGSLLDRDLREIREFDPLVMIVRVMRSALVPALICCVLYVAYLANFAPEQLVTDARSAAAIHSVAWLYCYVSLLSLPAALILYVVCWLLVQMWRSTDINRQSSEGDAP
jgi:hypothetical protein